MGQDLRGAAKHAEREVVRRWGWAGTSKYRAALLELRTACYVVVASLSGCRNHELAFIETGASYSDAAFAVINQALYRALQVPIGRFVAETADIELRRNKRLAHFDRAMHLAEVDGTVRFANASRAEVRRALTALTEVMNCVFTHFIGGGSVSYANPIMEGDGDSLAMVLRFGLRYRELVAEGIVPPDDAMALMARD